MWREGQEVTTDLCDQAYYNDLSRIEILDAQTERVLLERYKERGCLVARDRIIYSALRFVAKTARNFSRNPEVRRALLGAGNEGLLIGIDRFDIDKSNCRFLTYAYWHITEAMRQQLVLRDPVTGHKWKKKGKARVEKAIVEEYGDSVEREDIDYARIAKKTKMSASQAQSLAESYTYRAAEINETSYTAGDAEIRNAGFGAVQNICDAQLRSIISDCVAELPIKHCFALQTYYGLADAELNYREIGAALGVTHERARQITLEGLKIIRDKLIARGITRDDLS